MTERDMLLRAVLMDPADDFPRLVFADWLDEHGECDLAEFIRVQVELEPLRMHGHGTTSPARALCLKCDRAARLEQRERGMLELHLGVLRHGLPGDPYRTEHLGSEGFAVDFWLDKRAKPPVAYRARFRRGFVAEITLPLDAFLRHAGALFSAAPIERVTLSDRRPHQPSFDPDRRWMWCMQPFRDDGDRLPDDLFTLLSGPTDEGMYPNGASIRRYDTADLALADLSAACVRYGRSIAGLPAVPQESPQTAPERHKRRTGQVAD